MGQPKISKEEYYSLRNKGFSPEEITTLVNKQWIRPGVTQETYKGKVIPQLMKGFAESGENVLLGGRNPVEAVTLGDKSKQEEQNLINRFIPRAEGLNIPTAAYWGARMAPQVASMTPFMLAPELLAPKIGLAAIRGVGLGGKAAKLLSAIKGPVAQGAAAMGAHGATVGALRGEPVSDPFGYAGRVAGSAATGAAFGGLGAGGSSAGNLLGRVAEYTSPALKGAAHIMTRAGAGVGGYAAGKLAGMVSGDENSAEPLIYGALGAIAPPRPFGVKTPKEMAAKVMERYYRVIKPRVGGKSTFKQYKLSDLKNTDAMRDISANVEVAMPETRELPRTSQEALEAANNLKLAHWQQVESLVKEATGKGMDMPSGPIARAYFKVVNNRVNKVLDPPIVDNVRSEANRILRMRRISLEEGNTMLKNLNAQIEAHRASQNPNEVNPTLMRGELASILRENMDNSISNALGSSKGAKYLELRRKYGNLRTFEKEMANANRRIMSREVRGLVAQVTDPFIAMRVGEVLGSAAKTSAQAPFFGDMIGTAAATIAKITNDMRSNPNRQIRLMFQDAAKMNKIGQPGMTEKAMRKGVDVIKSGARKLGGRGELSIPGEPTAKDFLKSIKRPMTPQEAQVYDALLAKERKNSGGGSPAEVPFKQPEVPVEGRVWEKFNNTQEGLLEKWGKILGYEEKSLGFDYNAPLYAESFIQGVSERNPILLRDVLSRVKKMPNEEFSNLTQRHPDEKSLFIRNAENWLSKLSTPTEGKFSKLLTYLKSHETPTTEVIAQDLGITKEQANSLLQQARVKGLVKNYIFNVRTEGRKGKIQIQRRARWYPAPKEK